MNFLLDENWLKYFLEKLNKDKEHGLSRQNQANTIPYDNTTCIIKK